MKLQFQSKHVDLLIANRQYDASNDVMMADVFRFRVGMKSYTFGKGWKNLSFSNHKVVG